MASPILSTRNGPRSSDYIDFTHPHPNPNPNFSHFFVQTHQHLPYSAPPQPAFTRYPPNSGFRYITFRLSSYTRTELRDLKTRLTSELERVRFLRQRLFSNPAPQRLLGLKRTNPVKDAKKQRARKRMRECGQILGKLMQHKHGWVFNAPVDAVGLKLFDYHNIIKKPMDLGTIKSKLAKNEYNSPAPFASDVRLTFQNAMVYNGKGSNVYLMAERLLLLFENMWDSSNQKRDWVRKPAARVLKEREMTEAEKAELAARLMSLKLGREGMNQIMEIVKKGVFGLEGPQGDELELDIALLDSDTLWALNGFITRNSNKAVVNSGSSGGNEAAVVEEDVDIGEEMGSTVFTPIEIEKDGGSNSESSSEGGSSSSSGSGRNG